ncbi:MAG: choloylglycine hydrolase family protein [Polyangiaceae bacterium]|nr:choloylglycine hydrolase family protein [Polyangiaceae bacterium]
MKFQAAFVIFIFLHLIGAEALACTGILLRAEDGAVVPARTMEFSFDIHSDILVMPARYPIEKLVMDKKTKGGTYISQYAFVGANALGKPIVLDGINEKGLYFGAFYFKGLAKYQSVTKENKYEAISSEELGNYILSQYATVAEVKAGVPQLVVVGTYIQEIGGFAPFHYVVTDPTGASIVIEYTDAGLKIFDNTVNVVTNNPTYDWHLTNLNNYVGLTAMNREARTIGTQKVEPFGQGTGLFGLPGDGSSPSRFVQATAYANSAIPSKTADDAVFSAFHLLNHFDIPRGSVREEINNELLTEFTIWTSVVDTKNLIYYYKTFLTQRVEKVQLAVALKGVKSPRLIKMESGFSVLDRSRDAAEMKE